MKCEKKKISKTGHRLDIFHRVKKINLKSKKHIITEL